MSCSSVKFLCLQNLKVLEAPGLSDRLPYRALAGSCDCTSSVIVSAVLEQTWRPDRENGCVI